MLLSTSSNSVDDRTTFDKFAFGPGNEKQWTVTKTFTASQEYPEYDSNNGIEHDETTSHEGNYDSEEDRLEIETKAIEGHLGFSNVDQEDQQWQDSPLELCRKQKRPEPESYQLYLNDMPTDSE